MEPDLFLIRSGGWLMPALAAAACVSALTLATLVRAWRIHRSARLFALPIAGVRRGLRGARAGERVVARGRLAPARTGVAPFDDGGPCAIASASAVDGDVCRAAPSLDLCRVLGSSPIVGEIELDGACDARVLSAVPDVVAVRLRDAGMAIGDDVEGAIVLRHVRAGEPALVLGRATRAAAPDGKTYRDDAGVLGIGPDDDGRVHVVGLGTTRAHVRRVARVGVPVGLLATAVLLFAAPFASMYAPRAPWLLPQDRGELPHSLWLPLASPWRAHALRDASRWLTSADGYPGGAEHGIELARALRDVAPDCRRESLLVARFGWDAREGAADDCDTWIAREASTMADPPDLATAVERLRVLAIALDRGAALDPEVLAAPVHTLACAECGPISNADPERDPWVLASVLVGLELRSERMRRFRGEWLADLAIWQAARRVERAADPLDRWEPAISALVTQSAHDRRDDEATRRTWRATQLLMEASVIARGRPRRAAPYVPIGERLDAALRDATSALPPDAELRARVDAFAVRVTQRATGTRGRAIALARMAVLVEDGGAPEAARALALLGREVAIRSTDPPLTRFGVLLALVAQHP